MQQLVSLPLKGGCGVTGVAGVDWVVITAEEEGLGSTVGVDETEINRK